MPDKTAVVTGATVPGYGRAIAERLLTDGYQVIGTYTTEDKEDALAYGADKQDLELVEVNLEARSELASFVNALGDARRIDLIVFAQFFWNMEDPDNFDHDLWDRSIAVNLTAVNYLIHELKPMMNDNGNIVVITSTEGLTGSFGGTAYAAARAAEHNLVKSFANSLGRRNIRVNAVATGWIGSVMDTDEIFNMSRQITPLGRLGTGEEVANVVAWLGSPESSFVNGHVMVVDGGYTGVDFMAKYEFENTPKSSGTE